MVRYIRRIKSKESDIILLSKKEHDHILDIICRLKQEEEPNLHIPKKAYKLSRMEIRAENTKYNEDIEHTFDVEIDY